MNADKTRRSAARWSPVPHAGLSARLKPGLQLTLAFISGLAFAADVTTAPIRGKLIWKNGEALDGALISASPDALTWDAALFAEAPSMKLSALSGIEFSSKAATAPAEDFSVVLRDGSRLYASLAGITEDVITLRSARHGEMTIRQSQVVSMTRVRGGEVIYSGPAGDAGWNFIDKEAQRRTSNNFRGRIIINGADQRATKVPLSERGAWQTSAGGALAATAWNRAGTLKLALPESVQVDVRMRSSQQLEFNLTLTNSKSDRISIETWGDELVAVQGTHYQRLRKLTADDRTLSLRLCWDSAFGNLTVYGGDGTLLKQCAFPDRTKSQTDLSTLQLLNKSTDLTLESLRVRAWDGKPPLKMESTGARVELTDGRAISGKVTSGTTETLNVKRDAADPGQTAILDKIAAIFFDPPLFTGPQSADTQVWFSDGAVINGRLAGIKEGSASLQTFFSEQPVSATLVGARRIVLRVAGGPSDEGLDTLAISNPGTTLHGALVGTGDPAPRWRPVGSEKPVALKESPDMVFTHVFKKDAPRPRPDALLYLTRGEVVPARIIAMDREVVEMQSSITELHRVFAADLRAIQFNNTAEIKPDGFADPGWRQVRGDAKSLKRTNESIELGVGAAFGHPTILQGEEITFSIKSIQGYGAVRVRLFTPGTDTAASSASLVLGNFGNRVYVMTEEKGQARNQQQAPADYKRPSIVRLKLTDKHVEININGVVLENQAIATESRLGLGLIFESTSLWGNGERPVMLTDFSLKAGGAQTWVPAIAADPKAQALIIPRFRKDSPPHHVLLAANGDLLRGDIEAYAADHFLFLTGLETVKVPRNRVAAAIWLKQPKVEKKADGKTTEPPPVTLKYASVPTPPTHWFQLASGAQFGLAVGEFDADAVLGRHALLGACKVPLADISSIRRTAPAATAAMKAFEDWQLQAAPEPVLPETGGQDSPLLGKEAKDFSLPLLTGGTFSLSAEKGKVIVLDFWATWCGPCIKSLPELISSMVGFDTEKVKLVGVNQAEAPEQVKRFLETRKMGLVVALDADQKVGRQFGVEGIPHTVIIGPDGKIAWMKTGYEPGGAKEAADAVQKLLK